MKLLNVILIVILISGLISCREDKILFPEEPESAAIYVNSQPAGASIFVRSSFTNRITPAWIEDLNPGIYRVSLKFEGYADTTVTIQLTPAEKKYLSIQLRVDQ